MKEIIKKEYEVKFNSNIFSIHSISLDDTYSIEDNLLKGIFTIEGDYKASNLSLNLTDFKYTIPFSYDFKGLVNEDSINIDILDFTYKINKDILLLNIEYSIDASVSEFIDESEIDKMIDNSIDVIDFRDDEKESIVETILPEADRIEESNIFNDMKESSDEYITYKVHVVKENETIDNILEEYKINIDILKEYNEFDNITIGMKLIIPYNE